jgi:hypothetical protein
MSTHDPRATELLLDDALVGLSAEEQAELDAMMSEALEAESLAFQQAAAGIALAATKLESLPATLQAKLEEQAAKHLSAPTSTPTSTPTPTPTRTPAPAPSPAPYPPPISRLGNRLGWLAAAACLLIAIGAWTREPREIVVTKSVFVPHDVPPPIPPTPTEERERLLAKPGTQKIEWSATKDDTSKDAAGDVVWNAAEQKGTMRFRGLARNDPKAFQYQLWIFDKTRDDKYPVDGGVFDVDQKTGDVIVPITARVQVRDAALFAITVEKPGGVVVSKRERIVLTAKTPS